SFPLGNSLNPQTFYTLSATGNWSSLGLILGHLGEIPIYNAINFSWGVSSSSGTPNAAYWNNYTCIYAHIRNYLCPSDPNANNGTSAGQPNICCYSASVGTTTAPSVVGSDGLFTWKMVYDPRDVTDGLSNTVAYSEIMTAPTILDWVRSINLINVK